MLAVGTKLRDIYLLRISALKIKLSSGHAIALIVKETVWKSEKVDHVAL